MCNFADLRNFAEIIVYLFEIAMTKRIKKLSFLARRKGQFVLIFIGSLVVFLLFLNEDASVSKNMEYERRISDMHEQIKLNNDSADYYKARYEALLHHKSDLEFTAREQFHMQRPTEDVYIVKQ